MNRIALLTLALMALAASAFAQVSPTCPSGMTLQSCPAACVATPTPTPPPTPSPTPIPPTPTPVPPTPTPQPPTPTPTPAGLPQELIITSPTNGATVVSGQAVKDNSSTSMCGGTAWYVSLFMDGTRTGDFNFGAVKLPTMTNGSHTIWTEDHTSNGKTNPHYCDTSQAVQVQVGPTPTPTPTPSVFVSMLAPLTSGPLVNETGDASPLGLLNGYVGLTVAGGVSNYGDLANYTMGHGGTIAACCGPLLNDRQAASVTLATVEMPNQTAFTIGANRFYQDQLYANSTNQQTWESMLQSWRSAYANGPELTILSRVDGLCPIQDPTTAEAIQWAANKWGFNPAYGYAEAGDEGDWHMETLGDNGTSAGIFQVADMGANHGWPGLVNGSNKNLDRNSTCFNADFFFATRWATLNGYEQTDSFVSCGLGAFPCMIQTWCGMSCNGPSGGASTCQPLYNDMIQTDVISGYCNGGAVGGSPAWYGHGKYFTSAIPIMAPAGTVPTE